MTSKLNLSQIRLDDQLQSRVTVDSAVVDEYRQALSNEAKFLPVTVFYDGQDHWLVDGFHRYAATAATGRSFIMAEVIDGTYDDAFLYSRGTNDTHGLRRTNEDKRRSVKSMLDDPKWGVWTDREIARQCKVSPTFVGSVRKSIFSTTDNANPVAPIIADASDHSKTVLETATNNTSSNLSVHVDRCADRKRTVKRNGKTYEQDTSGIGKKKKIDAAPYSTDVEESPVSDEELYGDLDLAAELEAALKKIGKLEAENERLRKAVEQDTQAQEIERLNKALAEETEQKLKYWRYENEAKKYAKGQEWRCKQLTKELNELKRQVNAAGLVDF